MWIFPVSQEGWKKIWIYGFHLLGQAGFFNMGMEEGFTAQKKKLPVELISVLYFQMGML
jgi:hypothetical protein